MKTKIISTLKKELLIIETPLNATNIIFYEVDNSLTWDTENHIIRGYDLEGYTLLGKPDEIKEEDVEDLVESWESVAKDGTMVYENYKNGIPKKRNALESFHSALESEINWDVNPLGKKKDFENKYNGHLMFFANHMDKWFKAQEKTFDKKRKLIFVKN